MKHKELVFGTYWDSDSQQPSTLNGSSACFVLALDDVESFIERHRSKSNKSLRILSRTRVSEKCANKFLGKITEFALPHNKNWYRLSQLDKTIGRINSSNKFNPMTYLPLQSF